MDDNIQILKRWTEASDNIVFFGGAGVSTESGIPDFRSVDGLYNQKYDYPPETIISHGFFMKNTEEFYKFYRDRMIYPEARPNACHKKLAELERQGKLKAVITQNIDGLHQMAGSREVLELHGTIHKNRCMSCGKAFDLNCIINGTGVPKCGCGGIIKPEVVLYGEGLDDETVSRAIARIRAAELLIVGGTSLSVYPAAGLLQYYRGNKLVLINRTPTPYDSEANLILADNIGEVFSKL